MKQKPVSTRVLAEITPDSIARRVQDGLIDRAVRNGAKDLAHAAGIEVLSLPADKALNPPPGSFAWAMQQALAGHGVRRPGWDSKVLALTVEPASSKFVYMHVSWKSVPQAWQPYVDDLVAVDWEVVAE